MAAANCYAVALFKNLRGNPITISAASVSSPASFGRRRNHLRPKILKTLTKPYPTPTTSIPPPPVPLESPEEDDRARDVEEAVVEDGGSVRVEFDGDMLRREVGGELGVEKFSGKLDAKVGLYVVGLFVLQTVCAVLMFGSAGVARDSADDELESVASEKGSVGVGDDIRIRKIVSKASNLVKVDESVLEERIEEIRAMAREAREREAKASRLKSDVDGFGDEVDEVDEIEKEVSERLIRLQKKLGVFQDKSPLSFVSNMSKVEKGSGRSKEVSGSLVFKKKQTFRSSVTTKPISEAKGFSTVDIRRDSLASKNIFANDQDSDIEPSNSANLTSPPLSDKNSSINVSSTLKEDVDKTNLRKKALELKRRRANKKTDAMTVEPNAGDVQDISYGRKPVETSKFSTLASQKEIVKPDKNGALSLNGSSKNKGVRKTTLGETVRNKGSDNEAASRWLHLPYVFAILMRQGSGEEGPGGLYTLKATAKEAYTVAFEDRGDASNFCYILESFFEDMTDFSADIVPLPTNEIRQPMESGVLNMIIVKKGQVELYAGQPLGEVETLLRSLVL